MLPEDDILEWTIFHGMGRGLRYKPLYFLSFAGFKTFGELASLTEKQVTETFEMDANTLNHIREAMRKRGLRFAEE